MTRATFEQYKRAFERNGPDCILETAKHDLSEEEFARLEKIVHPPKRRGRKKKT